MIVASLAVFAALSRLTTMPRCCALSQWARPNLKMHAVLATSEAQCASSVLLCEL